MTCLRKYEVMCSHTSSLKTIIFSTGFLLPPALSVEPAQGVGSITFSFFRWARLPMFSQPFAASLDPDPIAGGGVSASEKMAIFGFPDRLAVVPTPFNGRGP